MVQLCDWDADSFYVNGKSKEAKETNKYIDLVKAKLYNCYAELQLHQKPITANTVKLMFLGIEEGGKTLMELCRYHNEQMSVILKYGTLKNYYTTEKYIQLFLNQKLEIEDIQLNKLTYQFIVDFEYFLRTNSIQRHNSLTNNGVMKHIERLKKLLNLAEKLEWVPKNPFSHFQLKFKKFDKVYLNKEELRTIETLDLEKPNHQIARDIFIFACYTGLSYVDVRYLKSSNITKGINGKDWIFTRRIKSNEPIKIPLLSKAKKIIDTYDNDITEFLLPVYSNQKINKYMKEICTSAGIYKNITFHSARHTFATTVTLSNGVPIETVSKLLGHTKLSTTQIYARVLQSKIGDDIDTLEMKLR